MGVFDNFLLFCLSVGGFKQSANGSYLSHHTLNRCKNFNAAAGLYRLPATLKFHPKVLILGFVDNIQLGQKYPRETIAVNLQAEPNSLKMCHKTC